MNKIDLNEIREKIEKHNQERYKELGGDNMFSYKFKNLDGRKINEKK